MKTALYKYKKATRVDIAPASGKITKNVKYRSRALDHGPCMKVMSRTITVSSCTLATITKCRENKTSTYKLTKSIDHEICLFVCVEA